MLLISKMVIAELGPKFTRKNVFPLKHVFFYCCMPCFGLHSSRVDEKKWKNIERTKLWEGESTIHIDWMRAQPDLIRIFFRFMFSSRNLSWFPPHKELLVSTSLWRQDTYSPLTLSKVQEIVGYRVHVERDSLAAWLRRNIFANVPQQLL